MVSKVTYTDITNKQTNGESGAALVNDTKRAINEVIDIVGDIDLGGVGGSTLPVLQPRQLGDGVKTTFNTPATGSQGAKAQHFDVYLNYVYQRPELDFSIDGATGDLTFLDNASPYAPNLNDTIDIKYVKPYSFDTSSDTPVEGTGTGVTKSLGDWFGEAGPAKVTATGTTTPRSLADRFGDSVSVKDFGAVGDGVTDDTAAFVAAATLAASTNRVVEADGSKTYYISTRLTNLERFRGNWCKIIAPNGFIRTVQTGTYIQPTQDYTAGDREIKVASTAGIVNGDILSLRSTDLLNTSRDYYYKGGNTKVTVVDDTTLAVSTAFPMDMTAASLAENSTITGMFIYPQKEVSYKDFFLEGDGVTASTLGIFMFGCSGEVRAKVSKYVSGIYIQRCVDVDLHCDTHTCATYGAVLLSTTNTTVRGTYSADGVGFDVGGNEPVYGARWEGGSYVSTNGGKGLSFHSNMWDATINNCDIQGINLSGHVTVTGGTLTSEVGQGSNYFYLHVGLDKDDNSYTFQNVHFERSPTIRVAGGSQVDPVGRDQLRGITLDNCTGHVALYIDLELTQDFTLTPLNIGHITVRDSDVHIVLADNVERLTLSGVRNSSIFKTLEQLDNAGVSRGYIDYIALEDFTLATHSEDIQVYGFGDMVLRGVNLLPGTSTRIQAAAGDGRVSMRDCRWGTSSVFRTDSLDRLFIDNSQITVGSSYIPNITDYVDQSSY